MLYCGALVKIAKKNFTLVGIIVGFMHRIKICQGIGDVLWYLSFETRTF